MAIIDTLEIKAKADVKDAISGLDTLQAKLNGLKGTATKATGAAAQTSSGLAKLVGSAKTAVSGIEKLGASIKRVTVYRAIRAAIKWVSQGFQEGVKNAYAWAEANNHAFVQVMDAYATRAEYLKNTLGALGSTVLTAVLPAFLAFTNALIPAINAVNEMIAYFSSPDKGYLEAVEISKSFGDNVNKATKAQKALNQQLMKFDELNVITTPKNSGTDNTSALGGFRPATAQSPLGGIAVLLGLLGGGIGLKGLGGLLGNGLLGGGSAATGGSWFTSFLGKVGLGAGLMGLSHISLTDGLTGNPAADKTIGGLGWIGGGALAGSVFGPFGAGIGMIAGTVGALNDITKDFGGFFGFLKAVKDNPPIKFKLEFDEPIVLFKHGEDAGSEYAKGVKSGWLGEKVFSGVKSTFGIIQTQLYALGSSSAGEWIRAFAERITASFPFMSGVMNKLLGNLGLLGNAAPINNTNPSKVFSYTPTGQTAVAQYASGGFPSMGSVFVAGEVPGASEFVGNINGRTGVASGEEITGISEAVYSTGGETNNLLRELIAAVSSGNGYGRPTAAFGRFVNDSLRLYKGVVG